MWVRVVYFIFILTFISCVSNNDGWKEGVYNWDNKEVLLEVQDSIEIDTIIDYIIQIHKIGDSFLIEYPYDWAVFKKKGNKLFFESFLIRKGNGPWETLASTRLAQLNDGRLFLGECIGSEKICISATACEKNIEEITEWNIAKRSGANPFYFESIQPVNDKIVIGGIQGNNVSKFVAYNLYENKYQSLNYTYPSLYDDLSDFEKSYATEGVLMKKPDANMYLFSTKTGAYTFIFDCNGETISNIKMMYNLPAKYKTSGEQGKRSKLLDAQTKYNVMPYVTSNCIYMSDRYFTVKDVFGDSGLDELPYYYTKEVVSFDWAGNPYRKYLLQHPIRSMFVNDGDSVLYGLGANDERDLILVYSLR